MELTVALAISIISVVITVINFALSRKDKALQNVKENYKGNHQELIEYQVKELKEDVKSIAVDVKDVKKMLDNYKETFRIMIKETMEEHIKLYHSKEN